MRFSELIFMILMVMVMMIMMTMITRMMNTVSTLQYKHIKDSAMQIVLIKEISMLQKFTRLCQLKVFSS